jgi:hypothetical protein
VPFNTERKTAISSPAILMEDEGGGAGRRTTGITKS